MPKKILRWKILLADKLILVSTLLLLGIFKPDYLLIFVFLLMFPYLILTRRKNLFLHFTLAFILSLFWVILARKEYSYNLDFISILGINLYPLFAWTLGLFAIYLIYDHYSIKIKTKSILSHLILFTLIYWPLLILGETFAYHVLDIRNLQGAIHTPLPICYCIHAASWMKASYFLLGPIFLLLCYIFNIESKKK